MRYIYFAIICICLILACIPPAQGIDTGAIIHYSETNVGVMDTLALEQDYSIKIVDMNTRNGDMWVEIYHNGEKLLLDRNIAKKNHPLEYVRKIPQKDDDETEHRILRVTPHGSVTGSDDLVYSKVYIEQFFDPLGSTDEYLVLDSSYSFQSVSALELPDSYVLKVTEAVDRKATFELMHNGRSLKKDGIDQGDIFYYTVHSEAGPRTVFIAKLNTVFHTEESSTIFLDPVTLRKNTIATEGTFSNDIEISIFSSSQYKSGNGSIAVVTYNIDAPFSQIRILLDGELLDSRKDVSPGTYKAVTSELIPGIYELSFIKFRDDGKVTHYSREFSVPGTGSGSLDGIAGSVADGIGNKTFSSVLPDDLALHSAKNTVIVAVILMALLSVIFFKFIKKFW